MCDEFPIEIIGNFAHDQYGKCDYLFCIERGERAQQFVRAVLYISGVIHLIQEPRGCIP